MPFVKRHRTYYKYVEDGEFVRPNLTANGTLGGDSFAVFATKSSSTTYDAYKAVDNSTDTFWQALSANGQSFIFYNPKPLKVTKLDITYVGTAYGIRSGIGYGSNDNSSWTELKSISSSSQITTWDMSDNAECYHYYKIYVVTGGADSYIVDIRNIAITATQYNVIENTPDDYDYYEDKDSQYILTRSTKKYYKKDIEYACYYVAQMQGYAYDKAPFNSNTSYARVGLGLAEDLSQLVVDYGSYFKDRSGDKASYVWYGSSSGTEAIRYPEGDFFNLIESSSEDYDIAEDKLTPYHLTVNNRIY